MSRVVNEGRPKISVIVPNYNNGRHLVECIESIGGQTIQEIEIIIVDDQSTDGSPGIIRELAVKDDRIRYFINNENIGVAGTRTLGLAKARADYVVTIDSDDYFFSKRKLEEEYRIAKQCEERNGIGCVVFSRTALVDIDGKMVSWRKGRIREGWIFPCILARTCEIGANLMFPRESFFRVGGYDQSLNLYEDWDLKIRLSKVLPFYYSREPGLAYRRHTQGLSSSGELSHMFALWTIFWRYIGGIPKRNMPYVVAGFSLTLVKLGLVAGFRTVPPLFYVYRRLRRTVKGR